jgi:hypothetical protein
MKKGADYSGDLGPRRVVRRNGRPITVQAFWTG